MNSSSSLINLYLCSIFSVSETGTSGKGDLSLPLSPPCSSSLESCTGVVSEALPKRPNSLDVFGETVIRPSTLDIIPGQLVDITSPVATQGCKQKGADSEKEEDELEEVRGILKAAVDRSASCTITMETNIGMERGHCSVERSASCGGALGRSVTRTGIEAGFDPLSLLAAESQEQSDELGEAAEAPATRRDLAEEIQLYMEHLSSPISQRSLSTDLHNLQSPSPLDSPRPAALLGSPGSAGQLRPQPRSRLFSSPSLPQGRPRRAKETRPTSLASPSSPTPSASSFSMDSLLTPTLDVFKSSFLSAGKGVAEKASRLYSRLSSQTSIAQVSEVYFLFVSKSVNIN